MKGTVESNEPQKHGNSKTSRLLQSFWARVYVYVYVYMYVYVSVYVRVYI
jgi:hypothetical protein